MAKKTENTFNPAAVERRIVDQATHIAEGYGALRATLTEAIKAGKEGLVTIAHAAAKLCTEFDDKGNVIAANDAVKALRTGLRHASIAVNPKKPLTVTCNDRKANTWTVGAPRRIKPKAMDINRALTKAKSIAEGLKAMLDATPEADREAVTLEIVGDLAYFLGLTDQEAVAEAVGAAVDWFENQEADEEQKEAA